MSDTSFKQGDHVRLLMAGRNYGREGTIERVDELRPDLYFGSGLVGALYTIRLSEHELVRLDEKDIEPVHEAPEKE